MKNISRYGLILLIVAIIGFFAVIRPQLNTFSKNSLDVKVKTIELKSYQQRLQDIEFVKSKGAELQRLVDALYVAMPRSSQIPEVLVMIEGLSGATGINFNSATVGAANGTEVPVSISFSGSLDSMNSFLDALHKNVRTIIVKNQSVISDKSGNLSVNLQLGLVYQGG